ncbi:hypothetical protein LTR99_011145 [Exophiala xenobiotica]|uniref:Uncharacterized protein n=1 Tax=Vermiconidia calcicola TaxID=1690605 RepID=A0AAV9PQF3_9PEZI|nr:hypothetical protein LTR92_011540 [Exophiala xenobiotica]KAK5527516.1 hypothetical protein LTR25_011129 [Vermiconidia calcicola]KAK5528495.1 hypothetical protein LTR23_011021 [Chaetothyriales sp. CCFEE 6169]KAK5215162.1 hypothetical protein LTR72_011764 [Exophiala xenobiotica]KAK5216911.1 hypothetical protein LTR47_011922 [Exophiala xenobiotica]
MRPDRYGSSFEHEPEKTVAIPSLEVWKFARVQIKIPGLMLKAKAAQAQPYLIVVFDSRDLFLFSVESSQFDDASLVLTDVYFILERSKM